ncbi:MAG: aminoacyl-tRNA hydrolase [bacterium]|nr:aminoacyl-tRNA hydrolase [bacterium]
MKVFIGLGNPGEKYQHNRHNVGFMFVDFLAQSISKKQEVIFKDNKTIRASYFELKNLLFVKPQTYMNKSGEAVQQVMQKYKLKKENLIIVHDDLDIPLGKFKIQIGTGPKLHNGLESIENHLGIKDFLRVRIGVDARTKEYWPDGESYALSDFITEEKETLQNLFPQIQKRLFDVIGTNPTIL